MMTLLNKVKQKFQVPYALHMMSFGISSGMPASFMFSTISMWLTDYHLSLTFIGNLSWTSFPYTIKILLSPFVDIYGFGKLTRWLGQRRGWAIATQIAMSGCFIALSLIHPRHSPWHMVILCFLTTLCAALQDIVLEAYRVEIIPPPFQAIIAGINALGFRLGMWVAGYLPLIVAHYAGWAIALRTMAGCILAGSISVLTMPEPLAIKTHPHGTLPKWLRLKAFMKKYKDNLKQPFLFLEKTYGALQVLGLIFSYKLGDVFIRSMWSSFLLDIHYSKKDIANVEKGLGMAAMALGVTLGTALIQKKDTRWGFILWGGLQSLVAFLFVWHAFTGPCYSLLVFSITANQLVGGLGASTNAAFISSLCRPPGTAEQYALMSSSGSLARMITTSLAGLVAHLCPWPLFFTVGALTCVPILCLSFFSKKPKGSA